MADEESLHALLRVDGRLVMPFESVTEVDVRVPLPPVEVVVGARVDFRLPVLTMPHPNDMDSPRDQAGRFALRNVRTCRTASGILSFVSFHGKKVSSDFGASIADSMAGS